MRSGDKPLNAIVGKGEMQGVRGEHHALSGISTVQVDDVLLRALQVFRLMRPIAAR